MAASRCSNRCSTATRRASFGFGRVAVSQERSASLRVRPKTAAKSDWGTTDDRDWGVFLLQGLPGVGVTLAEAIWDHFGGLPLTWKCTIDELRKVPGIGRTRARTLWNLLG